VSTLRPTHDHATGRFTSAALTVGVTLAAVCFVVAVAAEIAGVEKGGGEMTDVAAVYEGLLAFTPWAWASLGTFAVVLTPVAGLLVTAWEYGRVGDRRALALALAVTAVLAVSAVVAILR
jgi:uncharacterized membrane protein